MQTPTKKVTINSVYKLLIKPCKDSYIHQKYAYNKC